MTVLMKRRSRTRLLLAAPLLFTGGILSAIGHGIYGRDFRGVE